MRIKHKNRKSFQILIALLMGGGVYIALLSSFMISDNFKLDMNTSLAADVIEAVVREQKGGFNYVE